MKYAATALCSSNVLSVGAGRSWKEVHLTIAWQVRCAVDSTCCSSNSGTAACPDLHAHQRPPVEVLRTVVGGSCFRVTVAWPVLAVSESGEPTSTRHLLIAQAFVAHALTACIEFTRTYL